MRFPSPASWIALAGLSALLASGPSAALPGGGQPDGGEDAGVVVIGVPDASVGQGGADQGQESDDTTGQVATVCRDSRDCSKGFACSNRRCVYIGYREATGGCLLGVDVGAGAMLGLFLIRARGRRR